MYKNLEQTKFRNASRKNKKVENHSAQALLIFRVILCLSTYISVFFHVKFHFLLFVIDEFSVLPISLVRVALQLPISIGI